MIGSSASQIALTAVLDQPLEDRLRLARKTITAVESEDLKSTHRLCTLLRNVLASVCEDSTATSEQIRLCGELRNRVSKIDPRRLKVERTNRGDDLLASCDRGTGAVETTDGDPWLGSPPLPMEEWSRLLECEKPCQIYVGGQFTIRPGSDLKGMFEQALDARQPTVENLKRLHFHLENSFLSGGPALASGPLYLEVSRILREQGALPPIDPTGQTYGQKLLQELQSRD
jgi:hypothetical protein